MRFLLLLCLAVPCISNAQRWRQDFVAKDIDNFWVAYDKIVSTSDSALQVKYLKEFYIDKGTPGLKSLMEVRNYSESEYIRSINNYPEFWKSIRPSTLKVKAQYESINKDIQKLKNAYPALKPSVIYFSIGAFRTNATIQGDKILIGSELSLADKTTAIHELPQWRQSFYQSHDPIHEITLLCTHEYIHTQQKELVHNLLSTCLYEGVAEFVSCKVTRKKSTTAAIEFGKANQKEVVDKFVTDMFTMSNDNNWLWGENRNEFKVRDLGYYIGYAICERFYDLSPDTSKAIKLLIELDYTNEEEVERLVDGSLLFPKKLEELHKEYEEQRPTVISIAPFENGSVNVKPGLTQMTVYFSDSLLRFNTGLDYGPLGQEHFPDIYPERTFSEDGKSWTFAADLKPDKHYQILISNNFRKENGVRLKSYLIDFKTTE